MAITFGVATATGLNTAAGRVGPGALTIPLPTGWVVGQFAMILMFGGGYANATTPNGWNVITGSPFGGNRRLFIFYKFLQANETSAVTTISGNTLANEVGAAMMTFNGVDTVNPIDAVGNFNTAMINAMTAPAVNTTVPYAWAIGCCGRDDDEASSGQSFGGSTVDVFERLDAGTSQGQDVQVSAYSKEFINAGSTGAGSATHPAFDEWVSVIVALKPAFIKKLNGTVVTDVTTTGIVKTLHNLGTIYNSLLFNRITNKDTSIQITEDTLSVNIINVEE